MKYFYILSGEKKVIEVGRIKTLRYEILKEIVDFQPTLHILIPICFKLDIIKSKIEELLTIRDSKPLDIPHYDKTHWKETDIFEIHKYKGVLYNLCNTGFDNYLIFLINIYDFVNKHNNETSSFLLFTNYQSDFDLYIKNQ